MVKAAAINSTSTPITRCDIGREVRVSALIDEIIVDSRSLAVATDMLEELICNMGAPGGDDENEFERTFFVAQTACKAAAALTEKAEATFEAALPYPAKIRTASTDTGLIDHVLQCFRLADACWGHDTPDVRASVLNVALDAWIAKQKANPEALERV